MENDGMPLTIRRDKYGITLLRRCNQILNAYQDIEDELAKNKPNLDNIKRANKIIGKTIIRILPEGQ